MKKVPKYKIYFAIFDLFVLSLAFLFSAYLVRYDKSLGLVEFLTISYPILILFIIAAGFYFDSWLGAIGIIPILTASINWCPLYAPFGISTYSLKKES